jgi:DNA-binding FadR family transcriptional regulator
LIVSESITDKENQKNSTYEPVGPETRAADIVILTLEEEIQSGLLLNDKPLPVERNLMKRFNVSRTVIREAIAALSNRGLLESKPRFRPIVKKPGYMDAFNAMGNIVVPLLAQQDGVKNLYESRVFFERALVREAATSARRDDIHELREALLVNERAIDDLDNFFTTDVAFHRVLYKIPRNLIFPAIHHAIVSWLSPHWDKMPRSAERNRISYKSHERIFLAIEDRDPDGAEEALVNHLNAAWEYVRVTIDEKQL